MHPYIQVKNYKSDFEEERRDREAAHSKLADLEKDVATLGELKKKFEKLEKENKASEVTVKKLLADKEDSTLQIKRLEEKLRDKTTECGHLSDQVSLVHSFMLHNVVELLTLYPGYEAIPFTSKFGNLFQVLSYLLC